MSCGCDKCACGPCKTIDSQECQARLLPPGATFTEPDEAEKLRDLFGEPDENGVYGASGR